MDLVVAGNAYLNGDFNKCCIGIEDGKIAAIKKTIKGESNYDFGDKLILPAGIDIHVHFRDPGMTDKEDFESGSLSAAFGGICSFFDMPNTHPPVTETEALEEKIKLGRRRSFLDFGLYSAVTERSNLKKLAPISSGFKLFLGETTGNLTFNDLGSVREKINELNDDIVPVLCVHAESEKILNETMKKMGDRRNTDLRTHDEFRPVQAEYTAVSELVKFYETFDGVGKDRNTKGMENRRGIKLNICHVTSAGTFKVLNRFPEITKEVSLHHLLLSSENSSQAGSYNKVNPPLRTKNERIQLWNSFAEGHIPILASDHAPHTVSEKEQPFEDAPAGIPGVECSLPILLSHVKHGNLTLNRLVDASSVSPAGLFGLNKGVLSVGSDADLIVVDFKNETKLKVKMLHSKCEWTPYENMQVIFPIMTVAGGSIVIKNGSVESEPGKRKYLLKE